MSENDVFANTIFEPYWWGEAPRHWTNATELPKTADVVVIGSGYSGLSAALTASRGGMSVVVFEADVLGYGASTRNGGAVGETLRISFRNMVQKWGEQTAQSYYLGVREARQYLDHLIQDNDIECHYRKVGRFIGAHKPEDYQSLARDLEARKASIGFDAEMIPASQMQDIVGSDAYHGGRLIHSDGNLQPALLHSGLAQAAQTAGATIFDQTRVLAYERDGRGFRVKTSKGDIEAKQVIVATNGYTNRSVRGLAPWLSKRIIPIQSQIIATEEIDKNHLRRLIPESRQMGDTRKLHNYWRLSPDGKRLLFGGRAGATELNDRRRSASELRNQMLSVYPDLGGVGLSHAWAGFIAYTFDSLPHMASHQGVHYVGGCCGSGVAMQPYLGHQAALKALGRKEACNPFDTIHPTVPGYWGKPWFMPAVLLYFAWRDRQASK
ncbi:NAD(P)/FAD-dependent oxidoreductase [Aquibaculum sediminis]|uniref:NAD(P)/FAD-dependent oxidoreductase n=1 Tax=Aquibaculum sediminis TaxID=3231907 RepID=UPI00345350C8